ncbi:dentin sialophosphoprotein-like [Leguminivora glycinivorella]|uniref:dentin sialophosphoprotein-like n=1 Tax=Leguminivora glycinivorella TaxID=1035111 RepID=UPI00200E6679|nr:dentin sialophosphoprotein-like [Leguminivora glycinivorella]
MAEEVPVSDVLCDAMEYLCKLGSNLRTRSQNLKDKRISKDKLRNSHAVRKAASKVLLICELSRKSLENVENGVKRVLTLVDASRCSPVTVGAKDENYSRNKKNYFYFEHDSCRLRISEKILLGHYTSVKVHAKSMPESMMDKYPVYYNCRLYRKRQESLKDSGNVTQKTNKSEDNSSKSERVEESDKSDSDVSSSDKNIKDKTKNKKKQSKGILSSDDSDNSTKEKEADGKGKNKQKCRSFENKTKESDDETSTAIHSDGSFEDKNGENKSSEKESNDSQKETASPSAKAKNKAKSPERDVSSLVDTNKQVINEEKSNKNENNPIISSDEEDICKKSKKI